MGEWKKEIRAQLIDVRPQRDLDSAVREQLWSGALVKLSSIHAISDDYYRDLRIFQQHWLKAYCAGYAARKGIVTGRASAYLNDMWVVNTSLDTVCLVLKSTPPKNQWRDGVHYIKADLGADDIKRGENMSTTSPYRTFLDIARFDGFEHALVAADWLVKFGGFTPVQLQHNIATSKRFRGITAARLAAQHCSAQPDSAPESYARALLIAAGYEDVQANVTILAGGRRYKVDLLIDGWLVIEIDGLVKYDGETYGKTDDVLRKEKWRENDLRNLGKEVLRFPPVELEKHPERFLATVREAHNRRK
ncbi:hypothetical protein JKI95_06465 [Corynebacterium aquatimens]|uniref:hypothetical protein n=1 Tax=Corynebacterium TaxID=1716 RepID=UPI001F2C3D56|nr:MULTISPECIES: hypothetical protein [Corynebacterium]QYH18968.1 hypothetical protein JKI95_06465 [Corynebacterium aquatimens]UIZ92193.1 hypothetical protein JZY91_11235 [Corynebacterium sp. CNCTC7651]